MPGAGPKRKGNGFEREVVKRAQEFGLQASRSWGSDGRSRGLAKDVDIVIEDRFKVQCKRIKKLPLWIGLVDGIAASVIREDHGQAFALIRLDALLQLLAFQQQFKQTGS